MKPAMKTVNGDDPHGSHLFLRKRKIGWDRGREAGAAPFGVRCPTA
jgi:hypothetical protein